MKYKIIVDKQSRKNPSSEKKEYEIDIEELHARGNIYDSLIITKDEDYVIRRLELNEYNALNILKEERKEILQDINIELFEGDNYIYLLDMEGNKLCAEYLIKNDFTDAYVMRNEMNSAINQTAQQIELTVNQKLIDYATNEELEQQTTELNSKINQTAEEINLEVSKKVGEDEVCSVISQSAEEIRLEGNRVVIDSTKFKVDKQGNITATGGTIGGFTLGSTTFSSSFDGLYDYDNMDLTFIKGTIMETIKLSSSIQNILDVDNDGGIKATDWAKIRDKILNGSSNANKYVSGNLQIDTQNPKRCLTVATGGYTSVSIGAGGIFSSCIQVENLICGYTDSSFKFSGITLDWRRYKQEFVWEDARIGSLYVTSDSFFNIKGDKGFRLNIGTTEIIGTTGSTIEMYKLINMHGYDIINAGNVSSDRRLKKNIKDTKISAIDRIKQIKHKEFNWKKDNKKEEIGYIAQELEKIDFNYVRHNIEKDKEGNITSDMYEVRILPILSTATKAIQELTKRIEVLEGK